MYVGKIVYIYMFAYLFTCVHTRLTNRMLSVEEYFTNSITGYYLCLAFCASSHEKYGNAWQERFLPLITLRNLAQVCGHAVGRSMHWPSDIPFLPSKTTEEACEHMFGVAKMGCQGRSPFCKCAHTCVYVGIDIFVFACICVYAYTYI